MKTTFKQKLSDRKTFYKLLDSFEEKDFHAVLKFAEFVKTKNGKKSLKVILENIEYDRNELNKETVRQIEQAAEDYQKGKSYSLDQIKRELGIEKD